MRILSLFFFFTQFAFGSFEMNENMYQSYSHIIKLEFEEANMLLANEELQNPSNGFITLHRNYIDFLTIFITEDFNYFESHEKFKNERLGFLDDNDRSSPYYLYSKAEIILQWAFSRIKFEQYPIAIYELSKAYRLLERNQQRFPDFSLNKKGLGLIHSLLGAVPNEFHWILDVTGFRGDFNLGIRELDIVLNDDRFIMYESEILFLLSFLQINLGNNNAISQNYLDRIGERYRDNLLLNFAAARLSHNLGQNDYCLTILKQRPDNGGLVKFYYLDYLEGMCYLYMLDFTQAAQKIQYFLSNFGGQNYIKSAYHKLAWISFLEDDIVKQRAYCQKVISYGNSVVDEDKAALKQAQRNNISHPILLRARLLYDGGYYSLALSEMKQIEVSQKLFLSPRTQVEYWYRLARIKSRLLNNQEVVIQHYKKVLEIGIAANISSYYAPMSALQIALIYEKRNDVQWAKSYFNECLLMSGFDYEIGIHQKARTGLKRLSD